MRRSFTIGLAMAWLVLGTPPASSTPQPPPGGPLASPGEEIDRPIRVSRVSVSPGAEGGVTINVATTKSAQFRIFRLDSPDRLVVDLAGAINQVHRKSIPVSSPVVRDVRVGQFKVEDREVVRVVADLLGDPVFDAYVIAGGVRIEVKPRPMAASGAVVPTPERKLETTAKLDEPKTMQPAAPVAKAAVSSHVETHKEPAKNRVSQNSTPIPPPGPKEPAKNRASQNSTPVPSPVAKEPAKNRVSQNSTPVPSPVAKEPAKNRVSQNSTPVPSPAAKDVREGKSQEGNPEAVPVVDDVLRYLFGQGVPSPGTATPPAKKEGPLPVKKLEGPSLVSAISVRPGPAGEITIDVAVTKASPFQASRIGNPDRLVVDIKGARNQFPRNSIPVTSPLVKHVRVGQFPGENAEVVRVVVDLSGNPVCDAHPYAEGLRIEVKRRPQATSQGLATAASGKDR